MNNANLPEPSANLMKILPACQAYCLRWLRREGAAEYGAILADAERQADAYRNMPELYATDGLPYEQKIVALHYFIGGCDWWLIERDEDDFFGLCRIHEAEFGYCSIEELTHTLVGLAGIELDFHWTPRPMSEILREQGLADRFMDD